jgi:hypothetical protein
MSDLLILIFMVIASVGVAALILVLSEAIIITLPEMLIQAVKGNSAPLVPARQRSTDQNKARSCPFC